MSSKVMERPVLTSIEVSARTDGELMMDEWQETRSVKAAITRFKEGTLGIVAAEPLKDSYAWLCDQVCIVLSGTRPVAMAAFREPVDGDHSKWPVMQVVSSLWLPTPSRTELTLEDFVRSR